MTDDRRLEPPPGSRRRRSPSTEGEDGDAAPPREFDAAYRRLRPLAHRAAWRVLGDAHLAEDAASEAMVAAYDQWWMLRHLPLPQAEAWVATVSRRRAVDLLRARDGVGPFPDDFDPGDRAAEVELARVDDRDLLDRIMADLSRRQRAVWMLRYGSHLSRQEIGDRLAVAGSTVKTHLARARALLRKVTERRPGRQG